MNGERCEICGRDAIGIQCLGCCAAKVCVEHAVAQLREMKPGEHREWGVCYFIRFRA